MERRAIQFQKGLSLSEFQRLYGTEDLCEAALEKTRWPDGAAAHAAEEMSTGLSMAAGSSAISAAFAVIRPLLLQVRLCRLLSCR
jgi:hypothetical protein